MEAVRQLVEHSRAQVAKGMVGQQELVAQCLLTLLCEGHALLEGVPGIAKTLAVKLFARILGQEFQRVQCTSDLMPADIIGTNVLNAATAGFVLHRGPIFTDLLLVDEINRMPPRTQAALLEAMEERQVTIDGVRHPLSRDFTVLATQNPVEFEGTYPLPEAQLDRFLLKIKVDYPAAADEISILEHHHRGFDARRLEDLELQPVADDLLAAARDDVRRVTVEPALFQYLSAVVRRTREWPAVALGASPRAAINLMNVAKATAAVSGRDFIIPDDVKSAAVPVLRHRLLVKPEAELEGVTTDRVVQEVLAAVEVPR